MAAWLGWTLKIAGIMLLAILWLLIFEKTAIALNIDNF